MLKLWARSGRDLPEVSQMFLAVVVKVQLTMAMVNGDSFHRVGQHRRRGRRINILGVWQPHLQFDYALMLGTLKTATFLPLMD